jgi:hypothetical protein
METINRKNAVAEILKDKAPFGFIPNEVFYSEINVKRKKWAMIVRGEKEPTLSEFKSICIYFKVDIKNYI